MIKKISVVALVIAALLISAPAGRAQMSTPRQVLQQYLSDLQKNPDDYALREKIVKHVRKMKPVPAIPEEARRHYVMATTLLKAVKKAEDHREAIEEFRNALFLAPWWAEANRDLGMACEVAHRYEEAISALKLYVLSGPDEEKARAAQDEIYKIEAMKKLAAREKTASSGAVVEAQRNTFEDLLRKIDGRRYTSVGGCLADGITGDDRREG